MNQDAIWSFVDAAAPRFRALSDKVWATPETCYAETSSAQAHIDELQAQGFDVTQGIAEIPTAVVGHAGTTGPVIAFLGEYDALAGLSQVADLAEQKPVEAGANGHGCGHNMLGSAAMLAAVAVRDWLQDSGLPGQVRYYGCPAEEGGAAKAFMVRDGAFDDVDIAITWHPHSIPAVMRGSSLSNARVDFKFTGRASHAAMSPHLGRSALDAAELMNVGVNYLREHMPDTARLHYAYINAGGISPNVVQGAAHLRYVVRDVTAKRMLALLERVQNVAKGAALMTGTTVQDSILTAVSNLIANDPLCQTMQRNLDRLGPPAFSDLDRAYAAKFQETFSPDDITDAYASVGATYRDGLALPDFVVSSDAPIAEMGGSTDVADVSWVVPTVQMWGANYAIGTPFHSWQMVAQGKSASALKGMTHAAMVMAATGVDVLRDADLRERAWADLKARTGPEGYTCPIPGDAKPPIREMAS